MSPLDESTPESPLVVVLPGSRPSSLEALAHELQSPVKAIQLLAEAVRSSAGSMAPEQVEGCMESILRSTRFMAGLIGRMTEPTRLRAQPTDLGRLALETVQDMAGLLDGRPIRLRVEPVEAVPVDPVGIREVLVNLLSNAARYAPPRTPISLELRPTRDGAALTVADRCGGIPRGLRDRIFDPFVRGQADGAGDGLGLFLSRSIAMAHRGDLTVEDWPRGCRFTLTLPSSR
ncbi:MAG: sensor histidine kinase [Actinomycetota bacterium]